MDHQPLIGALALLALAGCDDDDTGDGAFDMPVAAAVVQPEVGGPFNEPIGYVANGHGGTIGMLALKQGRYLVDDPQASFLRSGPLPTGGARLLESIATWAPDEARIDVFVGDRAFARLLRVPHVIAVEDGEPIEVEATATDPVFLDVDGSGDSATLADLEVTTGYTATEDWSIAFDGERWWVEGTRSGKQERTAVTGEPYVGDDGNLAFTIEGTATVGDRFELSTDSGLVEYDVGGTPVALAMSPDQSVLAMVVEDDTGATRLRFFDPATDTVSDAALPDDASPTRLAWAPDGSALFVADGAMPAAWEVLADGQVIEHLLPWPIFDLAPLLSDTERLLYVAPTSGQEVWVVDLDTDTFVDVNAWVEGEQGLDFRVPVSGLEAIPLEFRQLETDDDGVHLYGRAVAVSLAAGRVLFMAEGTGCLVEDEYGPRTDLPSSYSEVDYETNFESIDNGAYLEQNATSSRHVMVNPCAGIARGETWTLTFDRNLQGWRVEGSLSGEQADVAYEDRRYVSDDGAISFTVRSGSAPSEDGWRIQFIVLEGALSADGDNDRDGARDVAFDLPGDPAYFHYEVGVRDAGWYAVDDRPMLLVPAQASDSVSRIEPLTGEVEIGWQ